MTAPARTLGRAWAALTSGRPEALLDGMRLLAQVTPALAGPARRVAADPLERTWAGQIARIGMHLAGQHCSPLGAGHPAEAFARTLAKEGCLPTQASVHAHLCAPAWQAHTPADPARSLRQWQLRVRAHLEAPGADAGLPCARAVTPGVAREWLTHYATHPAATAAVGWWTSPTDASRHLALALALAVTGHGHVAAVVPVRVEGEQFWPGLMRVLDDEHLTAAAVLCEDTHADPRTHPPAPLALRAGTPARAQQLLGTGGCGHAQGTWITRHDWMVLECPECARVMGWVPLHRLLADPEHGRTAIWALCGDPSDSAVRRVRTGHYLARARARCVLASEDDRLEWSHLRREPPVALNRHDWALAAPAPRAHDLRRHLAGRA